MPQQVNVAHVHTPVLRRIDVETDAKIGAIGVLLPGDWSVMAFGHQSVPIAKSKRVAAGVD